MWGFDKSKSTFICLFGKKTFGAELAKDPGKENNLL